MLRFRAADQLVFARGTFGKRNTETPRPMTLQIYNTLSNRIETFEPLQPGVVRMYNCGPTVYDYAHIGNFRSFLLADVLRRTLELGGLAVQQVMNLTDVGHMTEDDLADGGGQDKMEAALARESKKDGGEARARFRDPYELAEFFIQAFFEDFRALNLRQPMCFPRATQHVREMCEMIRSLLEKGYAYEAEDGTIYFSVERFPGYGRLSNNTLDALRDGAGGRVADEHQRAKRHPADFALWKRDERHLMTWDEGLGRGYPGWHIECSAMSRRYLGDTLDFHTGGEDNKFPHHECEIAQSEAFSGKPFVRYWVHATHLLVDGRKMSKREGNFYTIRDLLGRGYHPLAIRLALLKAHYRQPYNFTLEGLSAAHGEVRRFRECRARLQQLATPVGPAPAAQPEVRNAFLAALEDDLNVSAALAVVHGWVTEANKAASRMDAEQAASALETLRYFDEVLGVIFSEATLDACAQGPSDAEIQRLVDERTSARRTRDFRKADEIRDQLAAMGVEIHDTRDGTSWKRVGQLA